jgi:hydroxymethylpyrimidine pyrophosphatase-like HAD family hydrolase
MGNGETSGQLLIDREQSNSVIRVNATEIIKLLHQSPDKVEIMFHGIIPIFFFDLDATLIEGSVDVPFRSERTLTHFLEENQPSLDVFRYYLRLFKDKYNAKFVVTTGRDPEFAQNAWKALTNFDKNLDISGAICENGALIATNGWASMKAAPQLDADAIVNLRKGQNRNEINKFVTGTLGGGIEDKTLVLTYNNPVVSIDSPHYDSSLAESKKILDILEQKYDSTDEKVIHTRAWVNKLEEHKTNNDNHKEEMPSDTFNAILSQKVKEMKIKGVHVLTSGAHSMEILPEGINKAATIDPLLSVITELTEEEKEEFIKNHNEFIKNFIKNHNTDTPGATTPSYMLFAFGDSSNDLDLMKKGLAFPAAPSNAKSDVLTYIKSVNGYIASKRELKGSTSNIQEIAEDLKILFFAYGQS